MASDEYRQPHLNIRKIVWINYKRECINGESASQKVEKFMIRELEEKGIKIE